MTENHPADDSNDNNAADLFGNIPDDDEPTADTSTDSKSQDHTDPEVYHNLTETDTDTTTTDSTRESTEPIATPSSSSNQSQSTPDEKSIPAHVENIITKFSWPGKRLDRDEKVILAAPPHWTKNFYEYLTTTIVTIVLVGLIGHYLIGATNTYLENNLPSALNFQVGDTYLGILIIMMLVTIIIFFIALIRRLHTWHIITNQRTWVRKGVFSKRDLGSLDHVNINNVEEVNPFPLRSLNVGHLKLYTASTDGAELVLKYVKNPQLWKQEIRDNTQNN